MARSLTIDASCKSLLQVWLVCALLQVNASIWKASALIYFYDVQSLIQLSPTLNVLPASLLLNSSAYAISHYSFLFFFYYGDGRVGKTHFSIGFSRLIMLEELAIGVLQEAMEHFLAAKLHHKLVWLTTRVLQIMLIFLQLCYSSNACYCCYYATKRMLLCSKLCLVTMVMTTNHSA